MKRRTSIFIILAVALSLMLTTVSSAVEMRSSDQIKLYSMNATASTGSLNVEFSVRGTGLMDKIGCQSIYIYDMLTGDPVDSRFENDTNMSRTKASSHQNTIKFNGETGVRYRIVVTIFAEDGDGRDTRQQTFYVTGK